MTRSGPIPELFACRSHFTFLGSVTVRGIGACELGWLKRLDDILGVCSEFSWFRLLNWFVDTALLGGVLLLPLKEGKSVGCCPIMLVSSSRNLTIFNVSLFEILFCFGD